MTMNPWHDVPVGKEAPRIINAIVEIPKDCKIKYELDKETGLLKLDRYMFSAVHYPGDYGFVPQTLWTDGDPLDVFIITHRETYPLTLCEVKVIGVIKMIDDDEEDDKIVAVHAKDPRYSEWNTIDDVPSHFLKELHNFLEIYKELENKVVRVYEILNQDEAYKVIEKAQQMYKEKFHK
ncbi:MAG TPA: inorganic diphosphatase [Acidobacteriota bacterium]|nr:inorganic diphosphatase [Acidobacteriota bacterium]